MRQVRRGGLRLLGERGPALAAAAAVVIALVAGTSVGISRDRRPAAGLAGHPVATAAPPARSPDIAQALPGADAVVLPPPDRFEGDPAPPAPPPRQLLAPSTDNPPSAGTWAVVIGIDDYPGTDHDLRSATNDAADVEQALARLGVGAERRLLLRDGQATAANIHRSLDWLAARAAPDAVAVFFFAGHIKKLGGNTEALVAADGSLISDDGLAASLRRVAASRSWVALAGCYSGGFTEVGVPGRVLTAASPGDQLAYEHAGFGRSYLVEYMVRRGMLEGRADASVQAAFFYARDGIARDYPDRVPVITDWGRSVLDLRPPAPSPPSNQPPPRAPSGTGAKEPPPEEPAPPPPENPCSVVSQLTGCQ